MICALLHFLEKEDCEVCLTVIHLRPMISKELGEQLYVSLEISEFGILIGLQFPLDGLVLAGHELIAPLLAQLHVRL